MLRGNGIPAIRAQAAAEHEWGWAATGPLTKKWEKENGFLWLFIGRLLEPVAQAFNKG